MQSKSIVILLTSLLMSGCVYNPRFQATAVHYNTVVEDTNNRLLMQNIIRAEQRRPMYFTRISALRSNFTATAGATLGTSLPQQDLTVANTTAAGATAAAVNETVSRGVNVFSPGLSSSYSVTPGFDYQILDSQEFQRGIQSSAPSALIAYYLQLGWPEDLIASLLFEKVTITAPDGIIYKVENDPENPEKMKRWRQFLTCHSITGRARNPNVISFRSVTDGDLGAEEFSDFGLFDNGNWNFAGEKDPADSDAPDEGTLILNRPRSDTVAINQSESKCAEIDLWYSRGLIDDGERAAVLAYNAASSNDVRTGLLEELPAEIQTDSRTKNAADFTSFSTWFPEEIILDGETQLFTSGSISSSASAQNSGGSSTSSIEVETDEGARISVTPRSLQGVIYYLGECVRGSQRIDSSTRVISIVNECYYSTNDVEFDEDGRSTQLDDKQQHVIAMFPGSRVSIDAAALSTRLYGGTYWIPTDQSSYDYSAAGVAASSGDHVSWQTLAFVNQMLNLQKAATEAPSTTTIRTVN